MTNAGNVQWTVEWVDANGERRIKDDCIESASIADLYAAIHAEKLKAERRQLEESRWGQAKKRGLKRKREQNHADSQRKLDEISIQNETEFLQSLRSDHALTAADEAIPTQENTDNTSPSKATEASYEVAKDDTNEHEDSEPTSASSPLVHISTEPNNSLAPTAEIPKPSAPTTTSAAAPSPSSGAETQSNPAQHFYLLKPGTVSPSRVLISLKPEATLTGSLRDHTVQEYPTIYVLPYLPTALGSEFMLEADYSKRVASSAPESSANAGTFSGDRGNAGRQQGEKREDSAPSDAKGILKMLRRDVAL
jgi:hypothetical protein